MTNRLKETKDKWLKEKDKYDETVKLYESILDVLQFQQNELNTAFSDFIIEQAKQLQDLKKRNFKSVEDK
jgi:hypothetical protein